MLSIRTVFTEGFKVVKNNLDTMSTTEPTNTEHLKDYLTDNGVPCLIRDKQLYVKNSGSATLQVLITGRTYRVKEEGITGDEIVYETESKDDLADFLEDKV